MPHSQVGIDCRTTRLVTVRILVVHGTKDVTRDDESCLSSFGRGGASSAKAGLPSFEVHLNEWTFA